MQLDKEVNEMAATVDVSESNGAGPTRTDGVANLNYSSADETGSDPVAHPITPGNNSYEKWSQWRVSNMGGSSAVKNLKFFSTDQSDATVTHGFNGHTTQGTYDGANHKQTAAAQPATTATRSPETVPLSTSPPGTANIGIGGSLTGSITTATNYSDYVVSQIRTTAPTAAGKSLTLTWRYDEVAILLLSLAAVGHSLLPCLHGITQMFTGLLV